jgi:signal transduction histidine kinase
MNTFILGVVAAFSAFAGYWVFVFRRLLPLERELGQARQEAAAAAEAAYSQVLQARRESGGEVSSVMAELDSTHSLLVQRAKEARALHDVAASVASQPAQTALSAIVSIIAKYLAADVVAFLLVDEASGEMVAQSGAYGIDSEEQLYRVPLSETGSSSVRVFKTGRPFLTGDAQDDPQVLHRYSKLWNIRSLMVIPVRCSGRTIGVLRIGSFKSGVFTKDQMETISLIADESGILVEMAFLNRRLAASSEQWKELNRVKDDFISTVSHEFKTPLTTLEGFLSVVLDGEAGPLGEDQRRFLLLCRNSVRRLTAMVFELLDLSKLETHIAMDFHPISIAEVVSRSVEAQRLQAESQGTVVTLRLGDNLPRMKADARWIGLVFDNLLSNAIKFTRTGGHVELSAADKGDVLAVTVSDDGIGIPKTDHPHVFERFYRVSNRHETSSSGTGLGLAISREIILRHGGRMWLESTLGRGTKVHFVVPVLREGNEGGQARA